MIKTKKEYRRYIEEDLRHRYKSNPSRFKLLTDDVWRYQRLLRRCEYLKNTSKFKNPYMNPIYLFSKYLLRKKAIKLGFSIPENCFGEGLSIAHYGNIVVNPNARIGKNCRIHIGVNIGSSATEDGFPVIGDNVYLGPGAKVFGAIVIGNNTVIGANAVVNKSFPEGGVTIGGIPAKIISDKTSESIISRNSF